MKKAERTLELQVDIDAPVEEAWKAITEGPGLANWFAPFGEVSAPGMGAIVKTGWSDEMMMTGKVDAWEPMKHVRWLDESGWMGPGTAMAADYYLSTESGKTRVRLVQSAFGPSEGWDDLFEGIEVGWTYFLYNLRVYLERHRGRTRRMISERLPAPARRAAFWRQLTGGGLPGVPPIRRGGKVELNLAEGGMHEAIVDVLVPERGVGLRIPGLGDAVLFVEFEGKSDQFHVGYWLSVYDDAHARHVEPGARQAFRRTHEDSSL